MLLRHAAHAADATLCAADADAYCHFERRFRCRDVAADAAAAICRHSIILRYAADFHAAIIAPATDEPYLLICRQPRAALRAAHICR